MMGNGEIEIAIRGALQGTHKLIVAQSISRGPDQPPFVGGMDVTAQAPRWATIRELLAVGAVKAVRISAPVEAAPVEAAPVEAAPVEAAPVEAPAPAAAALEVEEPAVNKGKRGGKAR